MGQESLSPLSSKWSSLWKWKQAWQRSRSNVSVDSRGEIRTNLADENVDVECGVVRGRRVRRRRRGKNRVFVGSIRIYTFVNSVSLISWVKPVNKPSMNFSMMWLPFVRSMRSCICFRSCWLGCRSGWVRRMDRWSSIACRRRRRCCCSRGRRGRRVWPSETTQTHRYANIVCEQRTNIRIGSKRTRSSWTRSSSNTDGHGRCQGESTQTTRTFSQRRIEKYRSTERSLQSTIDRQYPRLRRSSALMSVDRRQSTRSFFFT